MYAAESASHLTSHTDSNGRVTNYVYYGLHRRTQQTASVASVADCKNT